MATPRLQPFIQRFLLRFRLAAALLTPLAGLLSEISAALPQGTAEDYQRSGGLAPAYRGKLKRFRPSIQWTDAGDAIHWRESDGTYVRVDTATGEHRTSKDPESLGLA
ncbi:MAG: hypothetical protein AAGG01_11340, partial [Planctomycetota bacterium]